MQSGAAAVIVILSVTNITPYNGVDVRGDTALHRAMHNPRLNLMWRIRRASEQDLSTKNKSGSTPLMSAVIWGNCKAVEQLLEKGTAQVNTVDNYRRTPLHYAAWLGLYDISSLLLRHGALCSVQDKYSLTPIDIALKRHDKKHALLTLLARWNSEPQEFEMIDLSQLDSGSSE